jgi:hypothetical protein
LETAYESINVTRPEADRLLWHYLHAQINFIANELRPMDPEEK